MSNNLKISAAAALVLFSATACYAADTLETGWQKPPQSAKPRTWWHWMNGNISKEGITRDLEAMKRVGIGGATIFQASLQEPKGPITFFTPEWHQMMLYAATEAKRLGIELSMHNCEGWSSSGGPWVKPDQAMKMLVFSEIRVTPESQKAVLPQPYTRINTYGDIAAVAFPTPKAELIKLSDAKITVNDSNIPISNADVLSDGDVHTTVDIPMNSQDSGMLNIAFGHPTEVRQFTVRHCVGLASQVSLEFQKPDGSWTSLGTGNGSMSGDRPEWQGAWPVQPTTATKFRMVFRQQGGGIAHLADLQLNGGARVPNLGVKTLASYGGLNARREITSIPAGTAIQANSVIDVTKFMNSDGSLSWRPKSGDWTVIRFGWTPITVTNHPATEAGLGLEVDKLSYQAVTDFYKTAVGTVVKNLGPLAGTTLKHILIDSYETGPQNWTQGFDQIFKDKNKYALLQWMPALTGRYVGNSEQTERFLWDFRKTVSDRWAQVYYDAFRKLCHENGMLLESEPYGDGPIDSVLEAGLSDIPMSEFWAGSEGFGETTHLVVSGAHTAGRNIVGAESFTGGGYEYGPFQIKKLGDSQWCEGINRFIFHTMALQYDEKVPGWTLGIFGTHFNRHNTWFNNSQSWMEYVARSQYLLQQGNFVADVLAMSEEGATEYTEGINLPFGWRSDRVALPFLMGAVVKNGCIVLPSGMKYRLLVLPSSGRISVKSLSKVHELVQAGAVVLGYPAKETPGLEGYPSSDAKLASLTKAMWGGLSVNPGAGKRKVGKGYVMWNMTAEQALKALNVAPDMKVLSDYSRINFIHRQTGNVDIYFVCNAGQNPVQANIAFRVNGKVPEIWHPDTGKMETPATYTRTTSGTIVPVRLDGTGSLFVVFRKQNSAAASVKMVKQSIDKAVVRKPLTILSAVYGVIGDAQRSIDITQKVSKLVKNNSLELVASNSLTGQDPASMVVKQFAIKYKLGDTLFDEIYPENGSVFIQTDGSAFDTAWATTDAAGKLTLTATKSGSYNVTLSNGRVKKVVVNALPQMTIASPWQVSFQQGWGAPANTTFNKLIDWSTSEDDGIRHYSGTAVYTTQFTVGKNMIAGDRRLYLDLGKVSIMATVTLNGKKLTTLWKPPFRTDVTGILKPGKNVMEVSVINTWVNQLIKDAGRPADQKKTWLTWQPYGANSRLEPSGLIGPVTIVSNEEIKL